MAMILPFPATRRWAAIESAAASIACGARSGERRLARLIREHRGRMLGHGIEPAVIEQQVAAMETAIRIRAAVLVERFGRGAA